MNKYWVLTVIDYGVLSETVTNYCFHTEEECEIQSAKCSELSINDKFVTFSDHYIVEYSENELRSKLTVEEYLKTFPDIADMVNEYHS